MNIDVYQQVTDRIVATMETHGLRWAKPWTGKTGAGKLPVSISTGNNYTGINTILLWAEDRTDTRWGTYKAWQAKGAQVRKGERGTSVIFFKQLTVKDRDSDDDKIKRIPLIRTYTVFNAEQCDNVPELPAAEPVQVQDGKPLEHVEAFISTTTADVHVVPGSDKAFYTPGLDFIQVPSMADFHRTTQVSDYYGTLLHELVHWTGHKNRLGRLQSGGFGSEAYAKEELVAELGSAFLCSELGIDAEPREDHAAYLQSWIKSLKNDKRLIVSAAAHAQRACNYLHGNKAEIAETEAEQ